MQATRKYFNYQWRKARKAHYFFKMSCGRQRVFAGNRPFSKMAAENLNKSKLKTNISTRKSTLTLVTLPSFSISGEISAEKMYVEN